MWKVEHTVYLNDENDEGRGIVSDVGDVIGHISANAGKMKRSLCHGTHDLRRRKHALGSHMDVLITCPHGSGILFDKDGHLHVHLNACRHRQLTPAIDGAHKEAAEGHRGAINVDQAAGETRVARHGQGPSWSSPVLPCISQHCNMNQPFSTSSF